MKCIDAMLSFRVTFVSRIEIRFLKFKISNFLGLMSKFGAYFVSLKECKVCAETVFTVKTAIPFPPIKIML